MNFKPRNAQNDNASSAAATAAAKRAENGNGKTGTLGKLAVGGMLLLPSAGLMLIPMDANADTCTVQRIAGKKVPEPKQMTSVALGEDNGVVVRVRDGAGRGVHIELTIPSSVSAPVIDSIAGKEAEAQRAALANLLTPPLGSCISALSEKLAVDKKAKSAECECASSVPKAKKPAAAKSGKAAPPKAKPPETKPKTDSKSAPKAPAPKGGDDLFGGLLPDKPEAKAAKKSGAKKPKAPAAKAETAAAQPKASAILTLTTQELLQAAAEAYAALVREGTVKPVPGKLSLRVKVNAEGRATKVVGAKGAKEYKTNKELVTAIAGLLSRYTFPEAKRGKDAWVEFNFTSVAKAMAKKPAEEPAVVKPKLPAGTLDASDIQPTLPRMVFDIYRKSLDGGSSAPVFGKLALKVEVDGSGTATALKGARGQKAYLADTALLQEILGIIAKQTFPGSARGKMVTVNFDFKAEADSMPEATDANYTNVLQTQLKTRLEAVYTAFYTHKGGTVIGGAPREFTFKFEFKVGRSGNLASLKLAADSDESAEVLKGMRGSIESNFRRELQFRPPANLGSVKYYSGSMQLTAQR